MTNSNTNTIKLTTPVTFNNINYTEVTVRAPKVGDLKLIDQVAGDVERSITLTASLTGIPELALEEISAYDWKTIQEQVAGFLQNAPVTINK